MKHNILNDAELDRQHRDWMMVTGTAVNQVHRSDGYKGPKDEVVRPRPANTRGVRK